MQITTATVGRAVAVSRRARKLIEDSTAPSTRRAYEMQLKAVDAFAAGRPLDDALVGEFITQRHADGLSPASLRLATAAINFRFKLHGQPSPVGPLTRRILAGAVRNGSQRGRGQVDGIDFSAADCMAAVAGNGGKSMAGVRNAAIIAVASDALLRVSEVSALLVEDIDTGDGKGKGATVTIQRSKTDQTGEGATLYLRPRTALAVKRWVEKAGITTGPLFLVVHRLGAVQMQSPLSPRDVRRVIQRCADAAGVGDGKRISGHSLRVGAAGDLAMRGATIPDLCSAGRWKTPAQAMHYARAGLSQQGVVARLRPA